MENKKHELEEIIKKIIVKHSFPEIDEDGVECRSIAKDKIDEMILAITSEIYDIRHNAMK